MALRHAPARDTQPRPGHPHFKLNVPWVKLENMKQLRIPGILSALALALVGCGGTDNTDDQQDQATEEAQPQSDPATTIAEQTHDTATAEINSDRLIIDFQLTGDNPALEAQTATTDALYAYDLNANEFDGINIVAIEISQDDEIIADPQYGTATIADIDFGAILPHEVWDHAQAGDIDPSLQDEQ